MVGSGIAVVVSGLSRESETKEAVDVVRIFLVVNPVFLEHDKGMDAIAPIFYGQLHTGHQVDTFFPGGFPEGFELLPVEFVMVRDDTNTDISLFEGGNIASHEILIGSCILELLIPASMQMEVRSNPTAAMRKEIFLLSHDLIPPQPEYHHGNG